MEAKNYCIKRICTNVRLRRLISRRGTRVAALQCLDRCALGPQFQASPMTFPIPNSSRTSAFRSLLLENCYDQLFDNGHPLGTNECGVPQRPKTGVLKT